MIYNYIKLVEQLASDLKSIEENEELLIKFDDRRYVVRVANKEDIENHKEEGYKP